MKENWHLKVYVDFGSKAVEDSNLLLNEIVGLIVKSIGYYRLEAMSNLQSYVNLRSNLSAVFHLDF